MKSKTHLIPEGLEQIRKIKSGMNSQRKIMSSIEGSGEITDKNAKTNSSLPFFPPLQLP